MNHTHKVNGRVNGHTKKGKQMRLRRPAYLEFEPTDEVEYGGLDALQQYFRDAGRIPLITTEREIELAALIKKGDAQAREELVVSNLRFVISIAKRYQGLGMSFLDLIGEGNIGLMKAAERFTPSKGAKFSTYASWWIKQKIRRAISNQSREIRLPVHMIEVIAKMYRVEVQLTKELGYVPSEREVAGAMNVSVEKVKSFRAAIIPLVHIDAPIGEDQSKTFAEWIPDEQALSPAVDSEHKAEADWLRYLLSKLSERERIILELRFGLQDRGKGMGLEEIGKKFKRTRERIRQVEAIALRKLRKAIQRQFSEENGRQCTSYTQTARA